VIFSLVQRVHDLQKFDFFIQNVCRRIKLLDKQRGAASIPSLPPVDHVATHGDRMGRGVQGCDPHGQGGLAALSEALITALRHLGYRPADLWGKKTLDRRLRKQIEQRGKKSRQ